jgi:periplasmic divalent cation tolerance protein
MEPVLLVLTNLPDHDSARTLAEGLVGARLAACVNVMAECKSVYRWKGKMEMASEVPVLIKTRAVLYDEVEAYIRLHHPYELPEVIAVAPSGGLGSYLEWVADETQPPAEPNPTAEHS